MSPRRRKWSATLPAVCVARSCFALTTWATTRWHNTAFPSTRCSRCGRAARRARLSTLQIYIVPGRGGDRRRQPPRAGCGRRGAPPTSWSPPAPGCTSNRSRARSRAQSAVNALARTTGRAPSAPISPLPAPLPPSARSRCPHPTSRWALLHSRALLPLFPDRARGTWVAPSIQVVKSKVDTKFRPRS